MYEHVADGNRTAESAGVRRLTRMNPLAFLGSIPTTQVLMPAGTWVFRENESCGRVGFVLSGTIRVFKEHESGKSITLYRLGFGDSCILSMSCALSNPIHQASAIVEEDAVVLTVTTAEFRELMDTSHEARDYVFSAFASRLTDVLMLLEEVVFRRMDARIAGLLLEHAARHGSDTIEITHEQLAEEAGTAREVVTRLLREFASNKWVSTARGVITLTNKGALAKAVS
jgi:CRP/FNR family transcriptional regulator